MFSSITDHRHYQGHYVHDELKNDSQYYDHGHHHRHYAHKTMEVPVIQDTFPPI